MAASGGAGPACSGEERRSQARRRGFNGIEAVEADGGHLRVSFIGPAPDISPAHVQILGGHRTRGLTAVDVRWCGRDDAELDHELDITLDRTGDLSTYTLRLSAPEGDEILEDFDARALQQEFVFTAECPDEQDCAPAPDCPAPPAEEPEISYLAKDYASFRRLILDRLALVMPEWTERHTPDVGITLIELLAYVGDYLSYYQDAVATEAYLDTARRRISVRRHVRLIDYPMHDGCNARAWVCLEVERPATVDLGTFFFVTAPGRPGTPDCPVLGMDAVRSDLDTRYTVFEPMGTGKVMLTPAHNSIRFWTWGGTECHLERGATRATLRDAWVDKDSRRNKPAEDGAGARLGPGPRQYSGQGRTRALDLHAGDVLVLEEVLGPGTGAEADADPARRQAVRLTAVEEQFDRVYGQPVLEVTWADDDALEFPLCLATVATPDCTPVEPAAARGNVILVDHGRTITSCGAADERIPAPAITSASAGCNGPADPFEPVLHERFLDRRLAFAPVTSRVPYPPPAQVNAGQAARLMAVPDLARERMRFLYRRAVSGTPLSAEGIEEIRMLYGRRTLEQVRFPLQEPRPGRGHARPLRAPRQETLAAAQAAALRRLLEMPRLLAKKTRWLEDLARRARAGLQLGPDQVEEVRQAWGRAYSAGLEATSPEFAGAARAAMNQDPRLALPVLRLRTDGAEAGDVGAGRGEWTVRRDLLGSGPDDRDVVVESDEEGVAHLRFGDGAAGRAPEPGAAFLADYRIGNGLAGNVGTGAINHIVFCAADPGVVRRVRNPLPAQGGMDPEPVADVRLSAPGGYKRGLHRAVTAEDYATLAGQLLGLQRAAAALRWTGSWYEAEVAADPLNVLEAGTPLLERIRESLLPYRRIGHDLTVERALYVPLLVRLRVCVLPHHARGTVATAVRAAVGGRGYFHPDNLTFGTGIETSRLMALVHAVPGVASVEVLRLERFGEGDRGERAAGFLRIGPLEIARLDDHPGEPENGQLQLEIGGGR